MMTKRLIRKFIPERLISAYHFVLAALAAFVYGWPSDKLKVIGITGTSGKSTTVHFLRHLLEAAGYKVCSLSTIDFYLAGQSRLNDRKMTMLGRFQTQAFLARAVSAGCDYAIIETTSQGIIQHRHRFINYDVAVLTNLYPEHLEAHGGFANYQAAKLRFFKHVASSSRKQNQAKIAVINGDSEHAPKFILTRPKFDRIALFGKNLKEGEGIVINQIVPQESGLKLKLNQIDFQLPFLGDFNAYNFAAAAAVSQALGLKIGDLVQAASKIPPVPGHLEFIEAGQPFQVLVDYAFEPVAMAGLYKVAQSIKKGRIIQVLGAAGGGRDSGRRAVLGKMAAEQADLVVVTNEDPYDDDPWMIIEQIAEAAAASGKRLNENLFKILDRRQAIARAISLAKPQDLILLTGKGAEQAICAANNQKIPWDDRLVVKEELSGGKVKF